MIPRPEGAACLIVWRGRDPRDPNYEVCFISYGDANDNPIGRRDWFSHADVALGLARTLANDGGLTRILDKTGDAPVA